MQFIEEKIKQASTPDFDRKKNLIRQLVEKKGASSITVDS